MKGWVDALRIPSKWFDMKAAHSNIRLFRNPYLEATTRVHPMVPFMLWAPIVSYLMYQTFAVIELPWLYSLLMIGFGVFVWTLTEYILHRFLFHFEAKSALGKRLVYLFHGIHHDTPNDATRLVMPPAPALMIGGVSFFLFWFAFGNNLVQPFFGGFIVGYLIYDYTHYYVHFFNPTTRFGRFLKQHHMLHHFAANEAKWGVSSPLWDAIFGTLGNHKK